MSAAWLTYPLALTGMRMFECGDFSDAECTYYKERWHFWYIADYVFALPTVAFFMCIIGIFIIGHSLSSLRLRLGIYKETGIWARMIAIVRYLSYRGFYVSIFRWNSAPVGVLVLGAIGTIFFFAMDLAPKPYYWVDEMFGGSPPLATRSGWLALGCMPFVFATASKTNWITLLTGVSHEKLQVFHRWIAYAFFVLALLHTFPFIVYHVHWHDMKMHFSESLLFYWTGIVALVCQAWITFMSHSTIRRLGYEFFKMTHFACVIIFMITFFWHCDYTLTSWHYFIATAAVYVPCFVFPWLRTIFEYKWTQQATLFVEENGFTRITIPVDFDWTPGQHCFLRFTSFGLLPAFTSHPFTICSLPSLSTSTPSELVFYIRHQTGFTKKLYQDALDHPGGSVPVLIDGPYGGVAYSRLQATSSQVIIAGGSGAGWCLPFIEHFFRCQPISGHGESGLDLSSKEETDGTKQMSVSRTGISLTSLKVILATREMESRLWFEKAIESLMQRYGGTYGSSAFQVHLTGEAAHAAESTESFSEDNPTLQSKSSANEVVSSRNVEEAILVSEKQRGRPRISAIIQEEAERARDACESLGVYACGPLSMQNDVRNAVAAENLKILRGEKSGSIYLHTEHFGWA